MTLRELRSFLSGQLYKLHDIKWTSHPFQGFKKWGGSSCSCLTSQPDFLACRWASLDSLPGSSCSSSSLWQTPDFTMMEVCACPRSSGWRNSELRSRRRSRRQKPLAQPTSIPMPCTILHGWGSLQTPPLPPLPPPQPPYPPPRPRWTGGGRRLVWPLPFLHIDSAQCWSLLIHGIVSRQMEAAAVFFLIHGIVSTNGSGRSIFILFWSSC